MKYKTRKIPGAPDWMPEGVVCKVNKPDLKDEDIIIGYMDNHCYPFRGLVDNYKKAEPIPAWEPTPGEYCAFWDHNDRRFFIDEFGGKDSTDKNYMTYEGCITHHIARITGVDCACSLEELKERTDWL